MKHGWRHRITRYNSPRAPIGSWRTVGLPWFYIHRMSGQLWELEDSLAPGRLKPFATLSDARDEIDSRLSRKAAP